MIKLYALSTCPWCKKTKRLLAENEITYDLVEVDLINDAEQKIAMEEIERLTGGRSFPVVLIGKKIIAGYNPDAILEALANEK
jgi:glutaredoxin